MNNTAETKAATVGRKLPLIFVPVLALFLVAGVSLFGNQVQAADTPQFLDSFAVSSMWGGQDWHIFVKGEDPEGEMDHIWVQVSQAGGNLYSSHFVRLKGAQRKAFAGYINLPTPHFPRSSWEYLKVEMKIRDTAGRYSQERVHEVKIGSPTKESIPPEWRTVENHQLGTIFFDFDSGQGESHGRWSR